MIQDPKQKTNKEVTKIPGVTFDITSNQSSIIIETDSKIYRILKVQSDLIEISIEDHLNNTLKAGIDEIIKEERCAESIATQNN